MGFIDTKEKDRGGEGETKDRQIGQLPSCGRDH